MEGVINTDKPLQYFFPAMCAVTLNVFLRVKELLNFLKSQYHHVHSQPQSWKDAHQDFTTTFVNWHYSAADGLHAFILYEV